MQQEHDHIKENIIQTRKNSSYTQFSVFKETDKNYFLYLFNNNESVREIFFWIDLKLSDYIFEL